MGDEFHARFSIYIANCIPVGLVRCIPNLFLSNNCDDFCEEQMTTDNGTARPLKKTSKSLGNKETKQVRYVYVQCNQNV